MSMQQLTIRGLDDELEQRLRRLAEEREISLNRAALFLMRRGAGLQGDGKPAVIGSSLDHLIGLWTKEEAEEFRRATEVFDTIDEDLWA